MQMFETLMLRQTTKVTVSPTSSARSSSAAWRISSIASGRLSANSAVSSSSREPRAVAALGDRPGHEVAADRALGAPPRAAARDERPVLRGDHVEHALRDPLLVDVAGVDAEPLADRDAVRREAAADLVGRGERVLGRDVVAVGGEPAEVRGAGGDELGPPVREVRRHLDADVGQQLARVGDELAQVVDRDLAGPLRQRQLRMAAEPRAPVLLGGLGRDLGRLLAVVAAVGHEVLEDQLLDVPVLAVHRGERVERGEAILAGARRCRRGCRS